VEKFIHEMGLLPEVRAIKNLGLAEPDCDKLDRQLRDRLPIVKYNLYAEARKKSSHYTNKNINPMTCGQLLQK
jgi:hypothetical protein